MNEWINECRHAIGHSNKMYKWKHSEAEITNIIVKRINSVKIDWYEGSKLACHDIADDTVALSLLMGSNTLKCI